MTSPLKTAWIDLAQVCLAVIPVTVHSNPDEADCHAVADDLDLLEDQIVDKLFRAYAEYAMSAVGADRDEADSFMGCIKDAIGDFRGNILSKAEELKQQRYDAA